MKMILVAAVLLASDASAQTSALAVPQPLACVPVEQSCPLVSCDVSAECWEVRVQYHRDGVAVQEATGGFWGSIAGATCWGDHITAHGFWREEWEHPTKIPAAVIDLVVIDRAVPRPVSPASADASHRSRE